MKKILALIIVLAIALSFSVPALAAGYPGSGGSALISACHPQENTKENNTPQTHKNKHGNTYIFIDVPDTYWAYEDIKNFIDKGIISGYGDGSFAPDEGVTREQFCKMLALTFNAPLTTPDTPSFSDVGPDDWSYPYVEACKDFLTAYASPFGGPPAFHPTEYATREDIAVALVRMMGLSADDVKNPNYAKTKFRDSNSITPALLPYVSLACELGLIGGYPDKTFRPTKSITRAEAVVLLGRATKQAVVDINGELDLSAKCVYSHDGKKVSVYIEADAGTAVTVDGTKITMKSNGAGKYEGVYTYEFTGEGKKTFTITGVKGDKTKTIEVTAEYKIGAPVLNITQCPTTSTTEKVTIKGTLTDTTGKKVTLTVNDKTVSVDKSGNWSITVKLKEGENKFVFVASNAAGVKTTQERTIVYTPSGLQLTITECPATVTTNTVTIRGTVTDPNYQVFLTINGQAVTIASNGTWSKTFTLSEGENKFVFVATNTAGKSVTQEKTVVCTLGSPTITVTKCPDITDQKVVTIEGAIGGEREGVVLYINDQVVPINADGSFAKTVTLNEGDNTIVLRAVNAYGKPASVVKTIKYIAEIAAPALTVNDIPATVNSAALTITGTLSDAVDPGAKVYVNDRLVAGSTGNWSATITLSEGTNTIVIVATNSFGKSTTIVKTVTYTPADTGPSTIS